MAVMIDAKLILCENVDTAATVTSSVLDLGRNKVLKPLYVDVKLTQGVSAGRVKSVELQTSADKAFTTPITEMVVTVGKTAEQQKRACQLAQFFAAIQPQGRFVRVKITGDTTAPAGGKLWAQLSPDIQVPL
nr:MAG TPA_asm: major capsid protein [Caudoviricetes sp.]